MASIRQEKVGNVIKQELSIIFQQEARTMFAGALVSVTQVRMSPDLGTAKAYISIFGVKDKEVLLQGVTKQAGAIRHTLGRKVRHQLRIVPHLHFYLDDSLDYADHIDDLLGDKPE
jgi:ribosome-binding factor A